MKKPENCGEFDGFDFPYDPARTIFLADGEENELTRKAIENVKKLKAEQEERAALRAVSDKNNGKPAASMPAQASSDISKIKSTVEV